MAFLDLIVFMASLQIVILIVLLLVTYTIKLRMERNRPLKQKRHDYFSSDLQVYPNISAQMQRDLIQHIHMTFIVFMENEDKILDKKAIIEDIFIPKLKSSAASRVWYDRYMAAVFFQYIYRYDLDAGSEELLSTLIHDPIALVSINAVLAACLRPTPRLFNDIISVYADFRRSQLEIMVMMLKQADLRLVHIILQRLEHETDPYIRAFCYRLLVSLPKSDMPMPYLYQDIYHPVLNCALAAIAYMFESKKESYIEHLLKLLSSSSWEIRARSLKFLGRCQDVSYLQYIKPYVHDPSWWVRFRAAEALSQLGEEGRQALLEAKLSPDRFARDIASQRIEQADNKEG